jgi:succinate dehydrogenase / fumarate reductase flavoprotein subunit
MFDHVGVFRTEEGMRVALKTVCDLKERFKYVRAGDQGKIYNTDLLNLWEIGNLLDLAEVTTVSALARTESRGGHARDDFSKRDDKNWLKHTMAWMREGGEVRLGYKPVKLGKYQPKERTY